MREVKKDSGFVALITAIILTAILLIITVTLNQTSFFTRGILLDAEYKERSAALAEACVDVARLKLANDVSYSGNETILIGSDECKIRPITLPNIETQGKFGLATTNFITVINTADFSVVSVNETPSF